MLRLVFPNAVDQPLKQLTSPICDFALQIEIRRLAGRNLVDDKAEQLRLTHRSLNSVTRLRCLHREPEGRFELVDDFDDIGAEQSPVNDCLYALLKACLLLSCCITMRLVGATLALNAFSACLDHYYRISSRGKSAGRPTQLVRAPNSSGLSSFHSSGHK